ncbi:MAG TPA: hypothetical protein VFZ23_13170 [Pyrinomonadaceae bacterium]
MSLQEGTTLGRYEIRSLLGAGGMGEVYRAVSEPGGYHEPSLSKDNTKILFGRSDGPAPQDIYIQDLTRGSTTRLTFDPGVDSTSVFSPDEASVVFYSNRGDRSTFLRKSSSGAGVEEVVLDEGVGSYPDDWSPDGKYILYEKNAGARNKVDLWVLPMTAGEKPFSCIESPFEEAHSRFSPDGRWVAYTSTESGRSEIYIQSFPVGNGKWQVSTAGGDQAQWRSDGKELYYIAPDRSLMSVSIGSGNSLEISRPSVLFQTVIPLTGITDDRNNFVPAKDGQRFLINTLADITNSQPLIMVLNWAGGLKK